MARYEVVVGNVGSVYHGFNKAEANKDFVSYVRDSKSGYGRAAGEDVALFKDGEIVREYLPSVEPTAKRKLAGKTFWRK